MLRHIQILLKKGLPVATHHVHCEPSFRVVEIFAVRTETLKNVEYGMAHVVQPSVKRSDQIILSRIQTPNLSKTLVVHFTYKMGNTIDF